LYNKNIYKQIKTNIKMTGKDKKLNYPETYIIRIDKELKIKLKKIGSKKVREYLKNIS